AEINPVRRAARVEELIAIGQPQRVVAKALNVIEHGFVAADPQSVRREVRGLQTEPVNPRDAHRLIVGVENLIAVRMPVTFPRRLRNRRRLPPDQQSNQYSQRDRSENRMPELPLPASRNIHRYTSSLKFAVDPER